MTSGIFDDRSIRRLEGAVLAIGIGIVVGAVIWFILFQMNRITVLDLRTIDQIGEINRLKNEVKTLREVDVMRQEHFSAYKVDQAKDDVKLMKRLDSLEAARGR